MGPSSSQYPAGYYLLAASAFLPLLTEPNLRATAIALVGGIGGNLLANVVERVRLALRLLAVLMVALTGLAVGVLLIARHVGL